MAGIIKVGQRTRPPRVSARLRRFSSTTWARRTSTACAARRPRSSPRPAAKPPRSRPRRPRTASKPPCRRSKPRSAAGSTSKLSRVVTALEPGGASDRPVAASLAAALGAARGGAGHGDCPPRRPPRTGRMPGDHARSGARSPGTGRRTPADRRAAESRATMRRLARAVEAIMQQLRLVGQAQIVADPTIAAGGCRVETRIWLARRPGATATGPDRRGADLRLSQSRHVWQ